MQAVEDRSRDELAVGGRLGGQPGVRIRDTVQTLMDPAAVVPGAVLVEVPAQLTLVPDQDPVEQFPAQGADEALDMGSGVGSMVRCRC